MVVPPHPPRGPTRGAVILTVVSFILTVVLLIGIDVYETNLSQHRWCDTLTLITAKQRPSVLTRVDPALYADFVKLRREFGCG